MKYFIGQQLQQFKTEGSFGLINDATFINCFWPKIDEPTKIFAEGSSGIKVLGRTPRNVWFPDDVEFLDYYPDAFYPAEQAVKAVYPDLPAMISLNEIQAAIWINAYNNAVINFPESHATITTQRATNYILNKVGGTTYMVELSEVDARNLMSGLTTKTDLINNIAGVQIDPPLDVEV